MKYTSRKKLGSYPTIGVIVSITLALFVVGLFGLLIIYSVQLEKVVRENVKMQVYLNGNLTETQRLQIENKIISMNFVNKNGDNKGIAYISKEEAAKKFIGETGEDFTQFIGDNPLKDAFLISIDPGYHSKTEIEKIKKDIEKINGVFEASYVEGLIESINQNIRKIGLILLGLVSLLLVTVILLINNTMRIALFSQRFLIRSMQLVGARQSFIQRPFLLRAAMLGLIGSIFAIALLFSVINYAQSEIEDLVLLHNQEHFLILGGSMALTGILISVISSFFSIRKYLHLSLDELF
ncbi:ABC transporter permease [Chryseotalea sanaruensis]|uniref:Cell division protein FtsX n=1 Tax=Chryseotalea sanaruensis TaxID=2482724 RepID=A0A401UAJ3_9BACT|nr:permease-like cell division protein FtsX [Chryseotalea sanaruensis]GCC51864.1 ABC transporter permease [Chryseotalea sanaruensis]